MTSWDEAKEACLHLFVEDQSNDGTYTCLTLQEYPRNSKEWYCNSFRIPPQYTDQFESDMIDESAGYDWDTASMKWASIVITYEDSTAASTESTAASTESTSSSSRASSTSTSLTAKATATSDGLDTVVIIVIAIGAAIALLLIGICIWVCMKRK